MKNLTLVIPAKNEEYSLPKVLNEIKYFKCKKIVVLGKSDSKTIKALNNFDCKIIKQKNSGYGNAIIEGINKTKTKYVCIFNADGSFHPKYLNLMLKKVLLGFNFVFASRYLKQGGSEDDTLLTLIGNKIFTFLGKLLFKLELSDILFTFILGETKKFRDLKLKSKDFRLCVEIPVKIVKKKYSYVTIPSFERSRLGGKKKVNEFKDGFLILFAMMNFFINLNKNN
jgi:glycosyltransferase involved in cell wall biosynthesis